MRLASLASILAATLFVAAPALADVGPPPTCEKGKHREYLMGHRCVPDGSHLEKDPNGGVMIVPDKALNASPPVPTATPTPSAATPPNTTPPAPSAATPPTETPAPPAATPPPSHGCACSITEEGNGIVGLSAALGLALVVGLRRTRAKKPSAR